jgi:hypothetical protein
MIALLAVAWAESPPEADFRSLIDQARFDIRKKYWKDAAAGLEKALATDDGALDPEAWFLLASVRFELGDVAGARVAAERAHSTARNDDQLVQASGFAQWLREQLGAVTLTSPHKGVATLVHAERQGPLFDPRLKAWLDQRITKWSADPQVLPATLWLPVGNYVINGKSVEITAGRAAEIEVPVEGTTPVGLQVGQLELGVGISALFGERAKGMLPSPSVELGVNQPFGIVVVGVMADWTPRVHPVPPDRLAFGGKGFGVGARVGIEIPGLDPMVLRPSIGYRFEAIPGTSLRCEADGADFICGRGRQAELLVFPVAAAHVPQVELAALYIDRRRKSGLGVGVKAVGELAFASLRGEAEALRADGGPVRYTVDEDSRTFVVGGLRVLFDLVYSF